jgi:hypothetical protein
MITNSIRVTLLAAIAVCLPLNAKARMGETLEQCKERYGAAIETKPNLFVPTLTSYKFLKNHIHIIVTILDGKAASVTYANDDLSPLDEPTVKALLDANAYPNRGWRIDDVGGGLSGLNLLEDLKLDKPATLKFIRERLVNGDYGPNVKFRTVRLNGERNILMFRDSAFWAARKKAEENKSELRSEDLPKFVGMDRDLSIPIIVDGHQVGLTGLKEGQVYRLVKVDGKQVTIRVADSDVVVPIDATDLLRRIERKQKPLTGKSAEDVMFDPSGWSVARAFSDSEVVFDGAKIRLRNRGRLLSKSEVGPCTVTGTFRFVGSPHDCLHIVLRTDGSVKNIYGQFDNGIFIQFAMQTDTGDTGRNVAIMRMENGNYTDLATARVRFASGVPVGFQIVDTGNLIQVFLDSSEIPIVSARTQTRFGNRIGIHNREGAGGGSTISDGSVVEIDDLSVASLQSP